MLIGGSVRVAEKDDGDGSSGRWFQVVVFFWYYGRKAALISTAMEI